MRLALTTIVLTVILICAAQDAWTEQSEYTVMRATDKIVLDGILDEDDWTSAPVTGDFAFPWHESGEQEQTEVKMLWDDTFLYIAYYCHDKHITASHYTVNSATYNDDCVELFWNPAPEDGSDYFMFEINCIGVPKSLRRSDRITVMLPYISQSINGTLNDDTDTDTGWVIEMAVRFGEYTEIGAAETPEPGTIWRVGLNRCGGKTNPQYSQWSPSQTDRPNFHSPDDFGFITFSPDSVR